MATAVGHLIKIRAISKKQFVDDANDSLKSKSNQKWKNNNWPGLFFCD